ncbi:MAG: hypothetical protein K9L86_02385 [Candidatus Omnitrophica bacterium]|nr:hypothetical protein [Candidatus Omnitrophota bacterium]
MSDSKRPEKEDPRLESFRRQRAEKITRLADYRQNYNSKIFMKDLENYFDKEVDFNFDKVSEEIEKPQRLENLIKKAAQKNTHPIIEFIQELFQDIGKSGDVEWSGEW